MNAGFGEYGLESLRRAGILWGAWPPPPGCPDDPMNGPEWSLTGRVGYHVDEAPWPDTPPRRLPDRHYSARRRGTERIVVAEPDGSHRVVRGFKMGSQDFSLYYGGGGRETLARRLALDVLGPLAGCPACCGGSVREWGAPGWCETCRGDGIHPDFFRAQEAIARAVAGRGVEWDISRSELLDAIVSAGT